MLLTKVKGGGGSIVVFGEESAAGVEGKTLYASPRGWQSTTSLASRITRSRGDVTR